MEKKIMYTEYEPDKKFLWLHTKNNNMVLEVFGDNGWESVGDDADKDAIIKELFSKIEEMTQLNKTKAIKVELPKLTEDCSKKALISAIEELKKALVKAGIIKIN